MSFIEAESKPNLIHRVFVDEKREFFFGYDLLVERVAETNQYRISVRPLGAEYEQHQRARKAFENRRPHPNINRAAFSSGPQLVGDGDTFALDVLHNPRAGTKIVDVVSVSFDAPRLQVAPESARPPRDFTLEDVQMRVTGYRLLVGGEPVGPDEQQLTGQQRAVEHAVVEDGHRVASVREDVSLTPSGGRRRSSSAGPVRGPRRGPPGWRAGSGPATGSRSRCTRSARP